MKGISIILGLRMIIALAALFLFFLDSSEGLVITELKDICKDEDYLTPDNLSVTCCENQKLIPGLSFEKYWKDCATPKDEEEDNVTETMWRVYTCIVDKHLESENKTLSLPHFAHVMTKYYPVDKRSAIFDKICKHSDLSYENLSGLELLKTIRRKYYDIELEVCSKNATAIRQKLTENPFFQKYYMRGAQCRSSDIPIDPRYFLKADEKDLTSTWETILENVSDTENQTISGDFYQMCNLYFNWISREVATADEVFMKRPDFDILFNRVKPSWANKAVTTLLKAQVDKYWNTAHVSFDYPAGTNTTEKLELHAIREVGEVYEKKLKPKFSNLRDSSKAKIMGVSCLIPAFMKSSVGETFLYMLCKPKATSQEKYN